MRDRKKSLDFFLAQNVSNSGRKHINVGLFQTHISFSPYFRDIKNSCVVGGLKKFDEISAPENPQGKEARVGVNNSKG